jgi:tetratricopeptide (TPR) repeat protein
MSRSKQEQNRASESQPQSDADEQTRPSATEEELKRLINQGGNHLERGRPDLALPYLQKARELDSSHVAAAINLAGAYILLGRHKEAIPLLEQAVTLEGHNPMIWVNLGAAYLGNPVLASLERQERAVQAFERALELQPGIPNVNYNLGLIFRDQQRWERARQEFERALELNPVDRDARMLLDQVKAMAAKDPE